MDQHWARPGPPESSRGGNSPRWECTEGGIARPSGRTPRCPGAVPGRPRGRGYASPEGRSGRRARRKGEAALRPAGRARSRVGGSQPPNRHGRQGLALVPPSPDSTPAAGDRPTQSIGPTAGSREHPPRVRSSWASCSSAPGGTRTATDRPGGDTPGSSGGTRQTDGSRTGRIPVRGTATRARARARRSRGAVGSRGAPMGTAPSTESARSLPTPDAVRTPCRPAGSIRSVKRHRWRAARRSISQRCCRPATRERHVLRLGNPGSTTGPSGRAGERCFGLINSTITCPMT